MNIIYCDGSYKKKITTSLMVTKYNEQYQRIKEVIYISKNTHHVEKSDNLHEILACLEAIKVIKELSLESEHTLIVNDSVADIKLMLSFQKDLILTKPNGEEIKDNNVVNMLDEIKKISLDNITFIQLPRTTLGINIVDMLNTEEDIWINEKQKEYLKKGIDKIINKPLDYNISFKNKKINQEPVKWSFTNKK